MEGHWRTFHADDKSASNSVNDLGVFTPSSGQYLTGLCLTSIAGSTAAVSPTQTPCSSA